MESNQVLKSQSLFTNTIAKAATHPVAAVTPAAKQRQDSLRVPPTAKMHGGSSYSFKSDFVAQPVSISARKANPAMSLNTRTTMVTMSAFDETPFGAANLYADAASNTGRINMAAGSIAPGRNLRAQANLGFTGGMMAAAAPRRATVAMSAAASDAPVVSGETDIKATEDF